jgi:hypothetical protein
MTRTELIQIAAKGYSGDLLRALDSDEEATDEGGDSLATFIVQELAETHDPESNDPAQLEQAIEVMQRAREDIEGVLTRLQGARADCVC